VGHKGDYLAKCSARQTHQMLMGRSFSNTTAPVVVSASGAEEPTPSSPLATRLPRWTKRARHNNELFQGSLAARSQKPLALASSTTWCRLKLGARFSCPPRFYYKPSFIRAPLKHIFEPFIRQAAGLAPRQRRDPITYEACLRFRRPRSFIGGGVVALRTLAVRLASGDLRV